MVCKNPGIYGFLGPSWVLISMPVAPVNTVRRNAVKGVYNTMPCHLYWKRQAQHTHASNPDTLKERKQKTKGKERNETRKKKEGKKQEKEERSGGSLLL